MEIDIEKIMVWGFVGIILFLIIIGFIGLHINTGNGEHIGIITAVERTGLIWKTGAAYVKTDTRSSQEDRYCVIDQNVYVSLQKFSETGEKVKISYYDYLIKAWYECGVENEGIISKVEPIK